MTAATLCVCRRELATGTALLLNRDASGNVADGNFGIPRINASGNRVSFTGAFVDVFQPGATMIANLTQFGSDLYVKDVGTGEVWHASKPNDGSNHGGPFGTDFAISDDGIPNLTRYFTGMEAAVPDRRFLPVQGVAIGTRLGLAGDLSKYLTLQVRIRRDLPAGYTWTVRTSEDIAGLESDPEPAVPVGPPVTDGDFDLHLFRFPTPMTDRGFMNVGFELPASS
jgi:hypothetical protein